MFRDLHKQTRFGWGGVVTEMFHGLQKRTTFAGWGEVVAEIFSAICRSKSGKLREIFFSFQEDLEITRHF